MHVKGGAGKWHLFSLHAPPHPQPLPTREAAAPASEGHVFCSFSPFEDLCSYLHVPSRVGTQMVELIFLCSSAFSLLHG